MQFLKLLITSTELILTSASKDDKEAVRHAINTEALSASLMSFSRTVHSETSILKMNSALQLR